MGRLFMVFLAAAPASGLAGSATAATPPKLPIAWDFVDTGLCGFPIHSVGMGTTSAHFVIRRQEGLSG
jgi:hypothetical protein